MLLLRHQVSKMQHRRSQIIVNLPLGLVLDDTDVGDEATWKISNNWNEAEAILKSRSTSIELAPLFDGTDAKIGDWGLSVPVCVAISSACWYR